MFGFLSKPLCKQPEFPALSRSTRISHSPFIFSREGGLIWQAAQVHFSPPRSPEFMDLKEASALFENWYIGVDEYRPLM